MGDRTLATLFAFGYIGLAGFGKIKRRERVKGWRILIVLLLCLVLAGSIACNPFGGSEPETTQQLVEVVRGDLTVTASSSGNIEVSNEIKLTFGIGGRVDKIYVEEGDGVSEGEVLARLETDDFELAVTQAKVAYTQAQVAVTRAKVAITQAELAVTQAQVAWQTTEYELDKATNVYKWPALEIAQADVERARLSVKNAQDRLAEAPAEEKEQWAKLVAQAQANLIIYEDRLNAMLSGADPKEVAIKKLQVEAAKQSLELARQSLELSQQSLVLNQRSVELAEQSLKQARKQLDKATITAPFAGAVARVYVDEGDIIPSPNMGAKIIIHLIDPGSMKLKVQVDEIDVPGIKLGQRAIIEVDALPALPLEGKVSSISQLPAIEAGVITYDVKINFAIPEDSGLRAGMSATTNIIINERSNVLLVPERTIKKDSQGNPIVEVMVNGRIEPRVVVTGISDGFQTEIVKGLNQGEMVVVERKVKPTERGGLF